MYGYSILKYNKEISSDINDNFKHSLQWFIDRMGKSIYRITNDYNPKTIISIVGRPHAEYLFKLQYDKNYEYYDNN